jgi:endonuclease/exonuclease/phosphatase family metal-dependent hydrolase
MRLLTWNLWAFAVDQPERHDAIVDVVRDLDPDLACFQEVRIDAERDVGADLARAGSWHLATSDALGVDWWQGRLPDPTATVVNAVVSRWPITGTVTVELPVDGRDEGRSALLAHIDSPGTPMLVVTTQLTSAPDRSAARCDQVRRLAAAVAEHRRPDELVLVTGDLNAEPDSDEVRLLCGHKTAPAADGVVLLDAWRFADPHDPGWTWDRRNPYVAATGEPDSRIDYVLIGPHHDLGIPRVTSIRTVGEPATGGRWPSDHLGVAVDLDLDLDADGT